MASQTMAPVIIFDCHIRLTAVVVARTAGLEARKRGGGIVDRSLWKDYSPAICRSACAGSSWNCSRAESGASTTGGHQGGIGRVARL